MKRKMESKVEELTFVSSLSRGGKNSVVGLKSSAL
jgi:hypothetical protein